MSKVLVHLCSYEVLTIHILVYSLFLPNVPNLPYLSAGTNDHKNCDLNNTDLLSYGSGDQKS